MLCLKDNSGSGVGAPGGERTCARARPGRLGVSHWTSGVEAWGGQGWSSRWVTVKVRGGVAGVVSRPCGVCFLLGRAAPPSGRYSHVAAVLGGSVLLVAGGYSGRPRGDLMAYKVPPFVFQAPAPDVSTGVTGRGWLGRRWPGSHG